MSENAKKSLPKIKVAMTNLDVGAAGDEIKHLCTGMSFASLAAFAHTSGKEYFEIRLRVPGIEMKRSILESVSAISALGEHAVSGDLNPKSICRSEGTTLTQHFAPKSDPAVSSSDILISPFSSVNGFRCHLKAMHTTKDKGGKKLQLQKPLKNRFADEVSTSLKDTTLVNVQQICHDKLLAFDFNPTGEIVAAGEGFMYTSCPCQKCDNIDASLKQSVMSSCEGQKSIKSKFTLFVELYSGNIVLTEHNRVISVLSPKTKQTDDTRRREKSMTYLPYYHNNISKEAMESTSNVIQCASLMASASFYDTKQDHTLTPLTWRLDDETPLAPLPTISAQFAIEMFEERRLWNTHCCDSQFPFLTPTKKCKVIVIDALGKSLPIILSSLRRQLCVPEIHPQGHLGRQATFEHLDKLGVHGKVVEATEKVQALSPFGSLKTLTTTSTKQRERLFTFTSTIRNSNSVAAFFRDAHPNQSNHLSQTRQHFSRLIADYFDKFTCKAQNKRAIPFSKVLVAFLLGIPLLDDSVTIPGVGPPLPKTVELDLTEDKMNGDKVFEILRKCLSQFDNMGPVLATHALTYAWDDVKSSRSNFQKACAAAGSAFTGQFTPFSAQDDVSLFLESPIPCPPTMAVANSSAEIQFEFLSVQQSIHEVAEDATINIPKGPPDIIPPTMLRALSSVRLQQSLLRSLKPQSDLRDGVNVHAAEEASVVHAESGPELANAILAKNMHTGNERPSGTRWCVEALFEALPSLPLLSELSDPLCSYVISIFLAPYIADICVLLHHRFRQCGDTFICQAPGQWIWAGHSYSPLSAQGIMYFGEHSFKKGPPTFVSEEIQKLKKMLNTKRSSNVDGDVSGASGGALSSDGPFDDNLDDLEVASSVVLAYGEREEVVEEIVADAIESESSPLLDPGAESESIRKNVTFSPSTSTSKEEHQLRRKKESEARLTEQKHLKHFNEQQVVPNPFAIEDVEEVSSDRDGPSSPPASILDSVAMPEPHSSYENYLPALRCLSLVSFLVQDNIAKSHAERAAVKEKYEDLAVKIEKSKAYVAATCSTPFLYKALGYGKGKSSLRQSDSISENPVAGKVEASVSLAEGREGSDVLKSRIAELNRKKEVVLSRASRTYVLPPCSTLTDHNPLRPPLQVSATLPVSLRSELSHTPNSLSPQIRPSTSASLPPPLDIAQKSVPAWPLQPLVDSLISTPIAEGLTETVKSAQREFFDFAGVGRSIDYYYIASAIGSPTKMVMLPVQADSAPIVLSSAADSTLSQNVQGRKGANTATRMIENTLKKHEDRKNNLELAAKGYQVNGKTLIAFADVVNAVLSIISTLVAQGSSWSAIEGTWTDRRKAVLDEVAFEEKQFISQCGREGILKEWDEVLSTKRKMKKNQSTTSLDSKAKLQWASADDDDIYSDQDDDSMGNPSEPEEIEEQNFDYFYEHQDELDPPPSSKQELIERVFGTEDTWLYRVITALNLSENSVTVSLPKVLEDDVPLEREPEMIDIEVAFTETAYANASNIFKRKKEVDVKVSKARQADDLVREGARRRALQKNQTATPTGKSAPKLVKGKQEPTGRATFRKDPLYIEATQTVQQVPITQKDKKFAYVPLPIFKLPTSIAVKEQQPSKSFSTATQSMMSHQQSFARSGASGGMKSQDSILFKKDKSVAVPPIDYVEAVKVLADAQDPVGDADCKSFWFLSSPSRVVAESQDRTVQSSLYTSFLILHPRDPTGAVKLLNEEVTAQDLVVYSEDPHAEGALPVVIKARKTTVTVQGVSHECNVAFSKDALEQAASMLFARSRSWATRKTERAIWCYGAQLVVRTREDHAVHLTGLAPPLTLSLPIHLDRWIVPSPSRPIAEYKTDTAVYKSAFAVDSRPRHTEGSSRHLYTPTFSCYYFDVVRGSPNTVEMSSQQLRLGLGLMFKEQVPDSVFNGTARAPMLIGADDLPQISSKEIITSLLQSPLVEVGPMSAEAKVLMTSIYESTRSKLHKSQSLIRKYVGDSSSEISRDESDPMSDTMPSVIPPFHSAMEIKWATESPKSIYKKTQHTISTESKPSKKFDKAEVSKERDADESSTIGQNQTIIDGLLAKGEDDTFLSLCKKLKALPESQLQQLLLYQIVAKSKVGMTKEALSTELKRKKKDAKETKDKEKESRSTQSQQSDKKKGTTQKETDLQISKPKSDFDVVASETSMSTKFVESTDKEVKKAIKRKESSLTEDNFSESESDTEEITAKSKKLKKGQKQKTGGGGASQRHLAIRMLIADELLELKKHRVQLASVPSRTYKPTTAAASSSAALGDSEPLKSYDVCVDILASPNRSDKLSQCWDKELRWLTGTPQHHFVAGSLDLVSSSVEYCIPVIAPIQAFFNPLDANDREADCPDRFKYFVELKPSGNEKEAKREKPTSEARPTKKSSGNFKSVFDDFMRMVGECVTTSYRNDYWQAFLQTSSAVEGRFESIDDSEQSDVMSRGAIDVFSNLCWQYINKQRATLVANSIEAALLERCTVQKNVDKYFQRLWEVSTPVFEVTSSALQAVVISLSPQAPPDAETTETSDESLESVLRNKNKNPVPISISFLKRSDNGRIDFNSAITRPNALGGGAASAFGYLVETKVGTN